MNEIIRSFVSALLVTRYLWYPGMLIIIPVTELLTFKYLQKRCGSLIVKDNYVPVPDMYFWLPYALVLFSAFWILRGDLTGIWFLLIGGGFFVQKMNKRRYGRINGLYDHGLVVGTHFFPWQKIHSWNRIDDLNISILQQNGLRFDYRPTYSVDILIEHFDKNGVLTEK